MKKFIFRTLSKFNKKLLPSFTKQRLDLQRANKFQMALLAWKVWVTKNSLD
ncbi:MAG TPA: SsrA-binding protein [Salinimicrobium sp.]|nr:SsrA-binding protein [Salinimicrobium sp.]